MTGLQLVVDSAHVTDVIDSELIDGEEFILIQVGGFIVPPRRLDVLGVFAGTVVALDPGGFWW